MPISERVIPSADVLGMLETSSRPPPESLLQYVGVTTVSALLQEFGTLTVFANEMFDSLMDDSVKVFDRIKKLSSRISDVANRMHKLDDAFIASRKFVKTAEMAELQRKSMFMFMPKSMPRCLQQRYQEAAPLPDFSSLDEYSETGTLCRSKYSHPEFFIEQWLIAEKQRQKEAELRRIRKREDRRARRKKEGEKKKGKQSAAGQRISVKAVKKKTYNVHGKEFDGTTSLNQSMSSTIRSEETPSAGLKSVPASRTSLSIPPDLVAPSGNISTPHEEDSVQSTSAFVPSEPETLMMPAPPPLQPKASPASPPPPPAPAIPPPPLAPLAAPPPPAAPDVPPPPAPSPSPPPAPGRSALLQSIQKGTTLRPVGGPPPRASSPRDDLLGQIRCGKQLRPTSSVAKSPVNNADDLGPYSEIKKLLDRRQFLVPEGNGSDASEDYDSDEWE